MLSVFYLKFTSPFRTRNKSLEKKDVLLKLRLIKQRLLKRVVSFLVLQAKK
jgi:hypothetical protein